jgi:hypothetical protein
MRNIASVWLKLLRSILNVNLSLLVLVEHLVDAFYDGLVDGDAVQTHEGLLETVRVDGSGVHGNVLPEEFSE